MRGVVDIARPVIGITAAWERARWSHWNRDADVLAADYADAVVAAGGSPVLLPARAGVTPNAVTRLDGVLLSGGPDVDPSLYGEDPHAQTHASHPDRDTSELAVLATAIVSGIPVLAVCRGAQLLNVWAGGTLDQHLPDRAGRSDHGADGVFASTSVEVRPGSRIGSLLGSSTTVHCHHHQAVAQLAPGLEAVAWAADGTVEAVELRDSPFVVGVQWHPEEEGTSALFDGLVEAARARLAETLQRTSTSSVQPRVSAR